MKKSIFCSVLLCVAFSLQGQTITQKTKKFAHEYLWKESFYPSDYYNNFESTKYSFFIKPFATKKYKDVDIKIYFFGTGASHSPGLILIEKLYKNNKSDYAVIGRKCNLSAVENMALFFGKYSFPEHVKYYCYDYLIQNYFYRDPWNPIKLNEDSLFTEHR